MLNYQSTDSAGRTYILVITVNESQNAGAAGDSYELTIKETGQPDKVSKGTITEAGANGALTLQPNNSGSETFGVTIDGGDMTAITGTIAIEGEGEAVSAPGTLHTHSYSAAWSRNAAQHWHECSCGDKKDAVNHTGNPCTVCGYTGGVPAITIEMVRINGGTFQMGSPTTEPGRGNIDGWETQHSVTLTQGFYMGKYQVTQEQYQAVMGTNPSYYHGGTGREPAAGEVQEKRPVEQVSWYDALVFCNKLSVMEGLTPAYRINGSTDTATWGTVPTTDSNATWDAVTIVAGSTGYRLPTEAQWEYACRAGTTTAYNTGATISNDTGWYWDNSGDRTHEFGKKPPNDWGLYDMHGNVLEWCWDWNDTYASGAQTDPTGAVSSIYRVLRGGSWYGVGQYLRSAYRGSYYPYGRLNYIGFRLARP